jgi:uncharacterized RDD family membrane protein YckC
MQNASLLRRLGAILYDSLLLLALMFLGTLPFVAIQQGDPVPSSNIVYRLVLATIAWLFFAGFWSGYGRTLGMQTWGLRIETVAGGRPGFARSSGRFLAAIISLLPAGLGFWWQIIDPDKLSWHDRLSGTRIRFYGKNAKKTATPTEPG